MTKEKEKTIFTRKLAYKLRLQGFKILRTEINPNKPQFECYIFEDTPEFHKAFVNLTNNSN